MLKKQKINNPYKWLTKHLSGKTRADAEKEIDESSIIDEDVDFEIKEEMPEEWLKLRTKEEADEFFKSGHGVNEPIKE